MAIFLDQFTDFLDVFDVEDRLGHRSFWLVPRLHSKACVSNKHSFPYTFFNMTSASVAVSQTTLSSLAAPSEHFALFRWGANARTSTGDCYRDTEQRITTVTIELRVWVETTGTYVIKLALARLLFTGSSISPVI